MARSKRLSDLNDVELREKLDEAKDDLFNLRFQSVIGQLDNHSLISETKKETARLLTELRAREIAEAEALAGQAGSGQAGSGQASPGQPRSQPQAPPESPETVAQADTDADTDINTDTEADQS